MVGNGFQNLVNHIQSAGGHASTWKQRLLLMKRKDKSPRQTTLAVEEKMNDRSKKASNWLNFMIGTNLPFTFVESEFTKDAIRFPSISVSFFLKCLKALAEYHYEEIKSKLLPSKFGLCFDGWACGSIHYVAIFAVFPRSDEAFDEDGNSYPVTKQGKLLSAIAPLPEMTNEGLTAASHISFIQSKLGFYAKRLSNVKFFCGDNCSVNKAMSNRTKIPTIGCYSHLINLGMKALSAPDEELLKKVNTVMIKCSSYKAAHKLSENQKSHDPKKVPLCPIKRNATRWSSTFAMLLRFQKIKDFIPWEEDVFNDQMMFTAAELARIEELVTLLKPLDIVTRDLQRED
jgi:hypothetical protein